MKNPSDQKDSRKARSREQAQAMHPLLEEIEKGRRSGEEEGTFSLEEVEEALGITEKDYE